MAWIRELEPSTLAQRPGSGRQAHLYLGSKSPYIGLKLTPAAAPQYPFRRMAQAYRRDADTAQPS